MRKRELDLGDLTHEEMALHLRLRRESAGLNVAEAARMSGTPAQTIHRWERTGRGDFVLMVRYLHAIGCRVRLSRMRDSEPWSWRWLL